MRNVVSVTAAAVAMLLTPAAWPSGVPNGMPTAGAAPCPEVEVVFARGRIEPPGTGRIGEAFVDAVRARTDKNVGFYAVNYPADTEIIQGANDMSRHIQYMAANCPATRLVLGGYSLGAAVTDVVVAVPSPIFGYNNPLAAGHERAHRRSGIVRQRNPQGPRSGSPSPFRTGCKTIDLCTETTRSAMATWTPTPDR